MENLSVGSEYVVPAGQSLEIHHDGLEGGVLHDGEGQKHGVHDLHEFLQRNQGLLYSSTKESNTEIKRMNEFQILHLRNKSYCNETFYIHVFC